LGDKPAGLSNAQKNFGDILAGLSRQLTNISLVQMVSPLLWACVVQRRIANEAASMTDSTDDGHKLAYGIAEAARRASVHRATIYRHAKAGQITIRKLGGRSVILPDEFAAYLKSLPVLGT
jgi:hypothetical protein